MCKKSMAPVTLLRPSVRMGRLGVEKLLPVGEEGKPFGLESFWPNFQWFSGKVEMWKFEFTRLGWIGNFFDSKWRGVFFVDLNLGADLGAICADELFWLTQMKKLNLATFQCHFSVSSNDRQWPVISFPIFPDFLPVFPWVARAVMSWKAEGTSTWLAFQNSTDII